MPVRVVIALTMASMLLAATASAEDLPDPTRPPDALMAPPDAATVEPPKPAGLQSVIISRSRSAAIIDGQTVELGGKYGDVRLIEVSDTGVILQGARGKKQVMTLFPGVSMSKKEAKTGP
jgi:MSHA biogenesis protein MshK